MTNIGRRERPRWSDERICQILSPESVPNLEEFHVSCLPQEGYSSAPSESSHRFLQLTQSTVHYLTENFKNLKCISGIESWNPKDTGRDSISTLLNQSDCKFAVISLWADIHNILLTNVCWVFKFQAAVSKKLVFRFC